MGSKIENIAIFDPKMFSKENIKLEPENQDLITFEEYKIEETSQSLFIKQEPVEMIKQEADDSYQIFQYRNCDEIYTKKIEFENIGNGIDGVQVKSENLEYDEKVMQDYGFKDDILKIEEKSKKIIVKSDKSSATSNIYSISCNQINSTSRNIQFRSRNFNNTQKKIALKKSFKKDPEVEISSQDLQNSVSLISHDHSYSNSQNKIQHMLSNSEDEQNYEENEKHEELDSTSGSDLPHVRSYKITAKTVRLSGKIIGNYIEPSATAEFDKILKEKLKTKKLNKMRQEEEKLGRKLAILKVKSNKDKITMKNFKIPIETVKNLNANRKTLESKTEIKRKIETRTQVKSKPGLKAEYPDIKMDKNEEQIKIIDCDFPTVKKLKVNNENSTSDESMTEDEDGIQYKEVSLQKFTNFESKSINSINLQNRQNSDLFKCPDCPMTFHDTLRLNRHKRLHILPQFQCRNCLRKFKRKSMLKKHFCDIKCSTCTGNCTCRMETSDDCIICLKINFRYFFDYKQHMLSQHNEIVVCTVCEKNNYTVFRHKQLGHTLTKYFKCTECISVFKSRDQLDNHMENHDKNFDCKRSGKDFTRPYLLKEHELNHDNPQRFHCELCDKSFQRKFCLNNHISKIHADKEKEEKYLKREREMYGERSVDWVKCSKCPALFKNAQSHLKHVGQAH